MINYPVYPYDSKQAKEFRDVFSESREKGLKTFWWEGREYTTEVKKK